MTTAQFNLIREGFAFVAGCVLAAIFALGCYGLNAKINASYKPRETANPVKWVK